MRDTYDLPDDLDALKAMIAASSAVIADRDAVIPKSAVAAAACTKLAKTYPNAST